MDIKPIELVKADRKLRNNSKLLDDGIYRCCGIGKSGGGKTYFLRVLLPMFHTPYGGVYIYGKNLNQNIYNSIKQWALNIDTDKEHVETVAGNLEEKEEKKDSKNKSKIPIIIDENMTEETFNKIMGEVDTKDEKGKKIKISLPKIVIFDDIAIKDDNFKYMTKIAQWGRVKNIYLVLITQNLNSIFAGDMGKVIRNNFNMFFIFPIGSKTLQKAMESSLSNVALPEDLEKGFSVISNPQNKHSCMLLSDGLKTGNLIIDKDYNMYNLSTLKPVKVD